MALFHFSANIISRGKGQSACAAIAYRAGEKIESPYDGSIYDYRQKQNVESSIILLPDNAPEEFKDRQTLWAAVESAEKQANAQLAREINIAIPRELSTKHGKEMVINYIQKTFVDDGMIADISFHNPPRMNSKKQPINIEGKVTYDPSEYIYDNYHAHIMFPLRPLDEFGKFEGKKQKLYVCEDQNGHKRTLSTEDLSVNEGFEKLYSYKSIKGKKSWHTKSYAEAHPEICAEMVNRYPKTETVSNPKIAKWEDKETLKFWRAQWANAINTELESLGMTERVSSLSYEDQGIDIIPTIHEGKSVTIEEKRLHEEYVAKISAGIPAKEKHTEIRSLNMAIKEHNEEIKIQEEIHSLKQQISSLLKSVSDRILCIQDSIAARMENLRAELIELGIKIRKATNMISETTEKISGYEIYLNEQHENEKKLRSLKTDRKKLLVEAESVPGISARREKEVRQKAENLTSAISYLEGNKELSASIKTETFELKAELTRLLAYKDKLISLYDSKLAEFQNLQSSIKSENAEKVAAERMQIRAEIESKNPNFKKSIYVEEAEKFDSKYECIIRSDGMIIEDGIKL